jgi:ribosomal protein L11 methyltransferase
MSNALALPMTREQAFALVEAVMERDDLALTASAHEDEDTGEWLFEATCHGLPDLDSFSALARDVLGGTLEFSVDPIDPEIDWVAKSLEGLHPVTAGGFHVYGSHDETPRPAGAIPIRIDAAQAFGTGHHETTTGCLEAIGRALRTRRYHRPIDIGTGTGVLAIAIAKRGHLKVLATDIDPVAVKTAIDNARDNGVGALVPVIEASGLAHPAIARQGPFDLIVANILAGPLLALAPAMGRAARRGATIILSGLLVHQAPRIAAAYAAAGMPLVRRIERKNWATLVLEKR